MKYDKYKTLVIAAVWFFGISCGMSYAVWNPKDVTSGGPPFDLKTGLTGFLMVKDGLFALNNILQNNGISANTTASAQAEADATGKQGIIDNAHQQEVAALGRALNTVHRRVAGQAGATASALDLQNAAIASYFAADHLTRAIIDSIVNYYESMPPDQVLADYVEEGISYGYIAPRPGVYAGDPSRFSFISKAFAATSQTDTIWTTDRPHGPTKVDMSCLSTDRGASCKKPQTVQQDTFNGILFGGVKGPIAMAETQHPNPVYGGQNNTSREYNAAVTDHVTAVASAARQAATILFPTVLRGTTGQASHHVTDNNTPGFFIASAYAQSEGDTSNNSKAPAAMQDLQQTHQEGCQYAMKNEVLKSTCGGGGSSDASPFFISKAYAAGGNEVTTWDLLNAEDMSPSIDAASRDAEAGMPNTDDMQEALRKGRSLAHAVLAD